MTCVRVSALGLITTAAAVDTGRAVLTEAEAVEGNGSSPKETWEE